MEYGLQHYPTFLGAIMLVVGVYNLLRDSHVKAQMLRFSLSPWLRWPALVAELLLGVLLLGFPKFENVAMAGALLFLLASFLTCLSSGWYRRMWLSGPLIIAGVFWVLS